MSKAHESHAISEHRSICNPPSPADHELRPPPRAMAIKCKSPKGPDRFACPCVIAVIYLGMFGCVPCTIKKKNHTKERKQQAQFEQAGRASSAMSPAFKMFPKFFEKVRLAGSANHLHKPDHLAGSGNESLARFNAPSHCRLADGCGIKDTILRQSTRSC